MATTLPPTPDQLRARSDLLTAKYPAGSPDPLEPITDDAIQEVQAITGRILDPAHPEAAASPWDDTPEAVPAGLVNVAVRATTLVAESMAVTEEMKYARQRAARLRLRGFSAGPYSEQYWDPAMVRGGSSGVGKRPQIVDDPDLDDVLWLLATEDARNAIIAVSQGLQQPAGAVSAFDYRRAGGGYQPTPRGFGRTGFGWGPDGF